MARIPVVAVVGLPDCGKTTLLEQLLPELKGRGLRIGTIKHHVHEFAMDTPGKDTWRHKQAGADAVVLASPTGIGLVRDTDRDLGVDELVTRYLNDADLVITEGYKHTRLPKIEVYRRELHPTPLPGRNTTWLAMVSAEPPDNLEIPCFAPDQTRELADFLVQHQQKMLAQTSPTGRSYIHLEVDGQPVPLNRFAASLLRRGIKGMIASLRGCGRPRKIALSITEGDGNSSQNGDDFGHAD
ncbi:molybdopterin-guanine dinucleotide biosynthesis protein B [Desulfurivibrio dismutans]|uniref:molybdopterin-guanine dinucleotide biosynthesis protein B n=1 Tax=Desulfurivibrio dismutans TaxID=1398908 RepID=UPI0023DCC779|nr:molybdopterin-guanine dinucleotide biosynthesis protein B [Desulfurivibrio alkaliphilus]MDF1613986.1 molybdopterin-guanine dinucleotide biosynthesis protein B [Desulfurivibrio alkaliphilus]